MRERVQTALQLIIARFVRPNSKAIAGAIAAFVVSVLVRAGVNPEWSVEEVVRAVADAVVTGAVVWVSPKNQPAE